ncbi:hypothetical protein F2Q70_00019769 [Brassica cretica]|uniref:Uncharacterized protein n=1 Tax=Brassica cretica TaxID=69181 RepID=A0A3N6S8E0_BRACR|nr:hypothetical protein F2Q70_00019769 [Brassica cretica]
MIRVYLDIKWETFARPLVLPLLNQLMSCLCVPHSHHNMYTSLRKLPANKEAKAVKDTRSLSIKSVIFS